MYKKIYFSLEVNDEIMILVANNNVENRNYVVGMQTIKTRGFANNVVISQSKFINQLKTLISNFEKKYLIKVEKVGVVVNSKNINSAIRTKTTKIEKNTMIGTTQIKSMLDSLKDLMTTEVKTVTCALPLDYKIDGKKVVSPIGKQGKTLEIKALLISSPSQELYSLLYAIELCGLTIIAIAPSFIANVFNSFDFEDNRKRLMLFDFGFNSLQVIHFDSGVVQNVFNLDFGILSFKHELEQIYQINDESFSESFEAIYKNNLSNLDYEVTLKTKSGEIQNFSLKKLKLTLNEIVSQTLVFINETILENVIDFSQAIFTNVIADFDNIYDLAIKSLNRETKIIKNDSANFDNSYYTNVIGMNNFIIYLENLEGLKVENSEIEMLKYIKPKQNDARVVEQQITKNIDAVQIKSAQETKNVSTFDDDLDEIEEYEIIEKSESKFKKWWSNLKNKMFDNKGESYDE